MVKKVLTEKNIRIRVPLPYISTQCFNVYPITKTIKVVGTRQEPGSLQDWACATLLTSGGNIQTRPGPILVLSWRDVRRWHDAWRIKNIVWLTWILSDWAYTLTSTRIVLCQKSSGSHFQLQTNCMWINRLKIKSNDSNRMWWTYVLDITCALD